MLLQYLPITETKTDDVVQFVHPYNFFRDFTYKQFYIAREPYLPTGYNIEVGQVLLELNTMTLGSKTAGQRATSNLLKLNLVIKPKSAIYVS